MSMAFNTLDRKKEENNPKVWKVLYQLPESNLFLGVGIPFVLPL